MDVSPAAPLFAFNDDAQATLLHIGRCGIAVTRIDNVLHDPQGIAALGFEQSYVEDRGNLYPGLRAPIPPGLSTALRAWLTRILQRNGMLKSDQVLSRDSTFFSALTPAPKH